MKTLAVNNCIVCPYKESIYPYQSKHIMLCYVCVDDMETGISKTNYSTDVYGMLHCRFVYPIEIQVYLHTIWLHPNIRDIQSVIVFVEICPSRKNTQKIGLWTESLNKIIWRVFVIIFIITIPFISESRAMLLVVICIILATKLFEY